MTSYDGSKAQRAHEILNLLQQLTALSDEPGEDGFLFRLVESGNREVFGNAYVSPRVMNALKAALESMLRCAQADRQAAGRAEEIPSGEWSAAAVAQNDPDLYAQVTDLFEEIFTENAPASFLNDVLNAPDPKKSAIAYEDLTGESDGGPQL